MLPTVTAVVATLGQSSLLDESLRSIERQRAHADLRLVVVSQGSLNADAEQAITGAADRHIAVERPLGFAAANNLALVDEMQREASDRDFVALVNDDAVLADDWLDRLINTLCQIPAAAAVQGLNRTHSSVGDGSQIDGGGIHWNRRLQATQIGHQEPLPQDPCNSDPVEVFGVSATAAVWRLSALQAVARGKATPFDPALDTYYEDVDLACRLRRAGFKAFCVPSATCWHAGSSSAPPARQRLLLANRHLVLARHLGRGYWPRVPGLLLRDLADFGAASIGGWVRVARLLPAFATWQRAHDLSV